jgi:hypothetical protein
MLSGVSECHTTASQSVATSSAQPPRFTTRNASKRARLTSGMYSAICVHTTASNEALGWASCVASSTPYESHFGGLRRLRSATNSLEMSMPMTAPSRPTMSAMLSHRKPGPQPMSSTRSPWERASCLMVSDRCARTEIRIYEISYELRSAPSYW